MLTQIFVQEGTDLSCVIGGKLPSIGGSGKAGSSQTMVCESCEFEDHFLRLFPDVSIILNVDADHLEYFKNIENIIKSFHKFATMASKAVIYNGDDANTLKAVEGVDKEMISFGWDKKNDYSAVIKSAARYSGVSWEGIEKGLDTFFGAIRRFEKIAEVKGVTIVDDYAHHPKEIECTLKAAKGLDFNRVWAVFQPFTYSRTKILMNDFVKALSIADIAVVTDIMGSREKNTDGVYAEQLAEKIPNAVWFKTDHELVDKQTAQQKEYNFSQCIDYIKKNCKEGDLVITLGCGDVYKLAKRLAKEL